MLAVCMELFVSEVVGARCKLICGDAERHEHQNKKNGLSYLPEVAKGWKDGLYREVAITLDDVQRHKFVWQFLRRSERYSTRYKPIEQCDDQSHHDDIG